MTPQWHVCVCGPMKINTTSGLFLIEATCKSHAFKNILLLCMVDINYVLLGKITGCARALTRRK